MRKPSPFDAGAPAAILAISSSIVTLHRPDHDLRLEF
jgi:hypothetical protein